MSLEVLRRDLSLLKVLPESIRQIRCHLGGGIDSCKQFLNMPQNGGMDKTGVPLTCSFIIRGHHDAETPWSKIIRAVTSGFSLNFLRNWLITDQGGFA